MENIQKALNLTNGIDIETILSPKTGFSFSRIVKTPGSKPTKRKTIPKTKRKTKNKPTPPGYSLETRPLNLEAVNEAREARGKVIRHFYRGCFLSPDWRYSLEFFLSDFVATHIIRNEARINQLRGGTVWETDSFLGETLAHIEYLRQYAAELTKDKEPVLGFNLIGQTQAGKLCAGLISGGFIPPDSSPRDVENVFCGLPVETPVIWQICQQKNKKEPDKKSLVCLLRLLGYLGTFKAEDKTRLAVCFKDSKGQPMEVQDKTINDREPSVFAGKLESITKAL